MFRDGDHSEDTVKTSEHPRAFPKFTQKGKEGGGVLRTD